MNFGPEFNSKGIALLNAIEKLLTSIGIGTFNTGVKLDEKYLAGIKYVIEDGETLNIPEYYEYDCTELIVDGDIECDGEIVIID
ncbi:MAG: hypothetical protein PHE56_08210 [Bacteroidales bacterium]|nr:hypothetical protein [Bacteroidales bacterium]